MRFRYGLMQPPGGAFGDPPASPARRDRVATCVPMKRRRLTLATIAALAAGAAPGLGAQQRKSLADPLRLGVDQALIDSGLAAALQVGFGHDTGIAVKLVPGAATPLLAALERGELDAAMTNAPDAEMALDKQGLVHDRQLVATGDFVLVGPGARKKQSDPAGVAGSRDIAEALAKIRDAALATPGALVFLSANDGSGTHTAEASLWRAAKIAPAAPWYVSADPKKGSLFAQLRGAGPNAYAIVERGAWAAQGFAPLAVLVDADPRQRAEVHVMRSFRVNHPAGKIFVAWITGPKGRAVVARQRSYRAPSGSKPA